MVMIIFSVVTFWLLQGTAMGSPSPPEGEGSCSSGPVSDDDLASVSALKYMHTFDNYHLIYFNGRYLAEVARTLLATAGRFPGNGFFDQRITGDEFTMMKEAGHADLAANLNRLPVLRHNDVVVGQSSSINRYLAHQLGFFGRNAAEQMQIDMMCEHIVDVKGAYKKADSTVVWFETPAEPVLEDKKERQLQWYLGKLAGFLPGDGYTVGGRPSLADAYFFNMLGEHAPELPATGGYDAGEPFGNLAETNRVMAMFPKVEAIVNNFKNSPGMQHYLANRGKQGF